MKKITFLAILIIISLTGLHSFSQTCSPIIAPYAENFESFTTSSTAFVEENCWTATGGTYFWEAAPATDTGSEDTGPDPSITTGNYFYTEASDGSNGDTTNLVSPLVDLTNLVSPGLIFNYHMFGNGIGSLDVLVNGTDTVFTISGPQQLSADENWEIAQIDLSAFAGQTISLTFRGTRGSNVRGDIAIDNVAIDDFCFQPTDIITLNITSNSAEFQWTENGSATLWDIELIDITAGNTATGTPTNIGVTNPFTITGLVEDNDYAFFVRADCGIDGVSNWTGPFNFRTFCSAFTAPYTEDFESFTTSNNPFVVENCWAATGGSYFWKVVPATDTGSSNTGPDPSVNTGNYFYTEASEGISGDVTNLVSPLVDVTNLTNPSLSFNYHMFGATIETLEILVNGTDTVFSLSGQQQTRAIDGWGSAFIDLSAYAGETIFVSFRGTRGADFTGDMAIDNVTFDELPACLPPSNLGANNITGEQADLFWTETGSATLWDIELIDITAGNTAAGTPTNIGVTNPFTITGLVEDNDYAFFVRANCNVDGTSDWAGPFNFTARSPIQNCNTIFLDSGGASGNYSDNEFSITTFLPEQVGELVTVDFIAFSTENVGTTTACFDGLTIYDGPDITAPTIDPPAGGTLWCWDRSDATPNGSGDLQGMSITSSHPSGALTFVFTSDGAVNRAGWEANLSCTNTLNINTIDTNTTFTYYPNPVENILKISAKQNIDSIIIYNTLGREVLKILPNAIYREMDMSHLQSGTYFVKVSVANTIKTVHIVKN